MHNLFFYVVLSMYIGIHVVIIIFNIYLLITLMKELYLSYPLVYEKVKIKLNFFFIFMSVLLMSRICVTILIGITFYSEGKQYFHTFVLLEFIIYT